MSQSRLSDADIKSIVQSSFNDSRLFLYTIKAKREDALQYYHREAYGDEQEGQSQVITSEVYDTVEYVLTDVMDAMLGTDRICTFVPKSEEDIEQAQIETDYVHHVFFQQNDGFLNTRTWLFDGIAQKNGVIKCYWDENVSPVQETYERISGDELASILMDEKITVKEHTDNGDGTHDITIERDENNSQIKIAPVAPENFFIQRDHRSLDINAAKYCCERFFVTENDLIIDGYDEKLVRSIPSFDTLRFDAENASRFKDEGSSTLGAEGLNYNRTLVVYDHYIRLDKDGDGKTKLYLVKMGGDQVYLSCEEVDCMPYHAWSPIPNAHKFYGNSKAEEAMDLQRINSVFMRHTVDNLVQVNHPTRIVNSRSGISLQELASPRLGKILPVATDNLDNVVRDLVVPNITDASMNFMSFLDKVRERRTGINEAQQGLTPEALSHATDMVGQMIMSRSQARLRLIARTFAETGFRSLMLHIHELACKYDSQAKMIDFGKGFTQVDPRQWQKRDHMVVKVGMGNADKMEQISQIKDILNYQTQAIAGGVPVVSPEQIYNALTDLGKKAGIPEINRYFQDPAKAEPKPPEPDPVQAQVQVLREQGVIDMKKKAAELEQSANQFDREMAQKLYEFGKDHKLKEDKLHQDHELAMRQLILKYDTAHKPAPTMPNLIEGDKDGN